MDMEKKLRSLFEYSKFEPNARLDAMISQTELRCHVQNLSDEDLWGVNAAGAPEQFIPKSKEKKQ